MIFLYRGVVLSYSRDRMSVPVRAVSSSSRKGCIPQTNKLPGKLDRGSERQPIQVADVLQG